MTLWEEVTEESPDIESFEGNGKRLLVWIEGTENPPHIMWFVYNGDYWAWYREDGWGGVEDDPLIPEDGDRMPTHWMELPGAPWTEEEITEANRQAERFTPLFKG